jgi:hypothetical protein
MFLPQSIINTQTIMAELDDGTITTAIECTTIDCSYKGIKTIPPQTKLDKYLPQQ